VHIFVYFIYYPYLYFMKKTATDKDKKYNVWTIQNKKGQFSNVAMNNDITWVDNIYKASFFNHNNASLIAQSKGLKDITIVKIS
jgi:hypothetical protein